MYKIFGLLYKLLLKSYIKSSNDKIIRQLGGGNINLSWPYTFRGIENFVISDHVSIGPGATIYSTGAKLIIEQHVIIGPNLTIITGDHMPIVGRYIDTVSATEKRPEFDIDVKIESNVWIGCNVTILKGVTIGKGSIVAAGAVVTKSCPPYSVIAGVPAKKVNDVFTEEEIEIHEKLLKEQA